MTSFVPYEEIEHLYSVMRISDTVAFPFNVIDAQVAAMRGSVIASHRVSAIEWICKIMNKDSFELRDMSVRIFDTYATHCFSEDPQILEDPCWTVFVAAASMLLACKMLHTHHPISAAQFTAFNTEDILYFERMIVIRIGGKMSSHATPAYFLDHLTPLCADFAKQDVLAEKANELVGEFFEDPNSLYFAPSTIAVASIIVTLSGMNINCQPFIDRVPDFLLFPNDNLPFFRCSENKSDYLDCQRCTRALQQLPSVRERIKAISPVSITACDL